MTRRQRRKFTSEFKHELACLILDQGYTYKQACESLDLTETALSGWVKQLQAERGGTTPKSPALTQDQQIIQELEAGVNRLEREMPILKKSSRALGLRRVRTYSLIDPLRAHEALVFICEVLEVPRSSYYDFCCKREQIDVERLNVKLQVKELFVLSRVSLGSRSICCLMTEEGIEIGRLMSVGKWRK